LPKGSGGGDDDEYAAVAEARGEELHEIVMLSFLAQSGGNYFR